MKRRLLLTGASGMVGRNIQNHSAAKDWEILAPSSRDLDLMDTDTVSAYIIESKPDLVIHSAGKVGGICANLLEPVAFLDQNVMIGRNVIMGAYTAGIKNLINLASTCIYPRAATNPLREDMLLTGELEPTNEGYAIAKIFALRLCEYIRRKDDSCFYKTLIPCNLYGPYDKFDPAVSHLVPAIIRKVHDAKVNGLGTVEIWGDGTARREFMFSGDLADAVFRAANDIENVPDLMNIGVGCDHSVNDYYASIARVIGWEGKFIHDFSKPTGMVRKLCDTTRQEDWGWQPKTDLNTGIAQTYKFFLEATHP